MGSRPPTKEQQVKIDDLLNMWVATSGSEPKLPGPLTDNKDLDVAIRLALKTDHIKSRIACEQYQRDKEDLVRVGRELTGSDWTDVMDLPQDKADTKTEVSLDFRRYQGTTDFEYDKQCKWTAEFATRCGDVIAAWFNKHWLRSSRHMKIVVTPNNRRLVLTFDWSDAPTSTTTASAPELEGHS